MFTAAEVSEIKRVSTGHLRLLGFKPLSCLKDYHNLRPSTFVFPSDEVTIFFLLYNYSYLDHVKSCSIRCFMNCFDLIPELTRFNPGSLQVLMLLLPRAYLIDLYQL